MGESLHCSHMKNPNSVFLAPYPADMLLTMVFVVYHVASLTGTHRLSKLVFIFVLRLTAALYLELHVISGIQQVLMK